MQRIAGVWLWERPLSMRVEEGKHDLVYALCLLPVVYDSDATQMALEQVRWSWDAAESHLVPRMYLSPVCQVGKPWGKVSSLVVALDAFLATKIVDLEPTHIPRYLRRGGHVLHPPPPIRVVKLRERRTAEPSPGLGVSRDWQYQWPVTGHWRRRVGDVERVLPPTWVSPYIKGPADKPFRPHQITVRAVER